MSGQDDQGSDRGKRLGNWPSGGPLLPLLFVLTATAIALVNVAGYVYQRIGLDPAWFAAVLIGSIVGSRINIPIWRIRGRVQAEPIDVVVWGIRYRAPTSRRDDSMTIAVNVGGAVIPTAVSVYLVLHDHIWAHSLIAIACVAAVVWLVARPVEGVGIVTPFFVPPLAGGLTAIAIGGPSEAALAYICGTMGTLIGADLLNLPRIRDLSAQEASIGGAGTFDGIFLAGLFAVVIATL